MIKANLFLFFVGLSLIWVALWEIDFIIWFTSQNITLYIPFLAWNQVLDKGESVNIAYWTVALGAVLFGFGAFGLGNDLK